MATGIRSHDSNWGAAATIFSALIAVVPVGAWVLVTWRSAEPALGWDQAAYFRQAQELLLHGRRAEWGPLLAAAREMTHYPFGYSAALALWLFLTRATSWWAILSNVIQLAFAAFLLYRIGSRQVSSIAGLLAGAFLLGSPLFARYGTDLLLEIPGAFLNVLFMAACFPGPGVDVFQGSTRSRVAAGSVLAAALFTKYHVPVLLVATLFADTCLEWLMGRLEAPAVALRRRVAFVAGWLLLPFGLWLLWMGPVGRTEFLRFFLQNRQPWSVSGAAGDAGHWLFYLRVVVERSFAEPLGPLVVVLALVAMFRLPALVPVLRFASVYVVVTLLAFTLYSPRLDRFVLGALPALCLVAGAEAARQLGRIESWWPVRLSWALRSMPLLACTVALFASGLRVQANAEEHERRTRRVAPALDFVGRQLAAVGDPTQLSFSGTFFMISAHAIVSLMESAIGQTIAHHDFWLDRRLSEVSAPDEAFRLWLENRRPGQRLITLEVLAGSPFDDDDYRQFAADRTWALAFVRRSERLHRLHELTTDSGLRLTAWRLEASGDSRP